MIPGIWRSAVATVAISAVDGQKEMVLGDCSNLKKKRLLTKCTAHCWTPSSSCRGPLSHIFVFDFWFRPLRDLVPPYLLTGCLNPGADGVRLNFRAGHRTGRKLPALLKIPPGFRIYQMISVSSSVWKYHFWEIEFSVYWSWTTSWEYEIASGGIIHLIAKCLSLILQTASSIWWQFGTKRSRKLLDANYTA